MLITVKNVAVEAVSKGKARWNKATVDYEDEKGNARKKYLVSFANPQVFEAIKDVTPETKLDVTVAKNEKDEWDWAKITVAGVVSKAAAAASTASGGRVLGSNYETAEERANRQLMIVRQSSISNAIARAAQLDNPAGVDILALAQDYVDFVYGNDLEEMDGANQDVPF